jgi:hypothetical protein
MTFLTNLSFNRHENSCMLLSKSVHSNRVSILGVGTSRWCAELKITDAKLLQDFCTSQNRPSRLALRRAESGEHPIFHQTQSTIYHVITLDHLDTLFYQLCKHVVEDHIRLRMMVIMALKLERATQRWLVNCAGGECHHLALSELATRLC